MKVSDAARADVHPGERLRVTLIAEGEIERRGHVHDEDRLLGQCGTIVDVLQTQLVVDWDSDAPGRLMLASDDEFELLP